MKNQGVQQKRELMPQFPTLFMLVSATRTHLHDVTKHSNIIFSTLNDWMGLFEERKRLVNELWVNSEWQAQVKCFQEFHY